MYPIALQIGDFQLRWYGVMAAAGFLVGAWVMNRLCKHTDLTSDDASGILFCAIISGVIGARIFYVVQFFDYYRNDLWRIIRIDQGGLVFYGGLLAIPSLWVYSRIKKIDFIRVLDLCAPALVIAHAFGRIGCFLNGCCFGKITDSCLGVHYPVGSEAWKLYGDVAVHPVQIYEALENVIFFFILAAIVKKGKRGYAMSTYLLIYGLLRFVNEFFRGDNYHYFDLLTIAQIIGLILIPTGSILLWFFAYAGKKDA